MSRLSIPLTLLAATLGMTVGTGAYAFFYARGASYLTDDPTACANCHVMREQYDGWSKSSHRNAATCNDCHTLPGIAKLRVKTENGFRHSFAFTTGRFPDPIRITSRNGAVSEIACRSCHADIVSTMVGSSAVACARCHGSVGHLH